MGVFFFFFLLQLIFDSFLRCASRGKPAANAQTHDMIPSDGTAAHPRAVLIKSSVSVSVALIQFKLMSVIYSFLFDFFHSERVGSSLRTHDHAGFNYEHK